MSHLLDQFRFFKKRTSEYADGHGEVREESRDWENFCMQLGSKFALLAFT